MHLCSSTTQGPAWVKSHFHAFLWPDTLKLCQKSGKSPLPVKDIHQTILIYI